MTRPKAAIGPEAPTEEADYADLPEARAWAELAEDELILARGPIREDGLQVVVTGAGRKLLVNPADDSVIDQTVGPGTTGDHDNPVAPPDAI